MGQLGHGHQIFGQFPRGFPGCGILDSGMGHDDDETGHGADDVGIQENPGSG